MDPRKPEHANKVTDIARAPGFQTERRLMGYAYARNGNTHNPTPRYHWLLLLDGRRVDEASRCRVLIEAARQPDARKLYTD
jgi:hypothetical protein